MISGRTTIASLLLILSILPLPFLAACGEKDAEPGDQSDTTTAGDVGSDWSIDQGIGPVQIYTMTMTMDQSTEVGGEAIRSAMTSDGTIRMRKTDSSAEGSTWIAVMNMSMQGTTGGSSIPAMNQTQRLRYLVSPEGRILEVNMKSDDAGMDESIQQVMQQISERHNASQFFLKEEWADHQPGESWEETVSDTIDLDSIAFMGTDLSGALDLRFLIRTRYTFRGEVDTLGMTMIRIDTETLEMSIDGTISAESMEMQMESRGTGEGTQYFDPVSRLYTVGIAEQKMLTTMDMPSMNMTVPMNQTVKIVSVRGDLVD